MSNFATPRQRAPGTRIKPLRTGAALVILLLLGIGPGSLPAHAEEVFAPGPSLLTPRARHTATTLMDGRILVAGGYDNKNFTGELASAEVYDPATDSFSATGPMAMKRYEHTATRLADGRVLIVGGHYWNGGDAIVAAAELFDPSTSQFTSAGDTHVARLYHTSTLLNDGRVLIVGNYAPAGNSATAEVYDPTLNQFSPIANLNFARDGHTATLLPDGRVLLVGGEAYDEDENVVYPRAAELFDPTTNQFIAAGQLLIGRFAHSANLLPNGDVLIAGGEYWDSVLVDAVYPREAERFSIGQSAFLPDAILNEGRSWQRTAPLKNGNTLVAGGMNASDFFMSSAEVYDVASGKTNPVHDMMLGRRDNTASVLGDGSVLIIGGSVQDQSTPSTERYVEVGRIFHDGFGGDALQHETFEDRLSFLEAISDGYFVNNFNGLLYGSPQFIDYVGNGFAYRVSASNGSLATQVGIVSTELPTASLVITFTGEPVTAIGGNFWPAFEWQPTATGVTITLSDGTVESFTSEGIADFRGFATSSPITWLRIDATAGKVSPSAVMDNLIVGRR